MEQTTKEAQRAVPLKYCFSVNVKRELLENLRSRIILKDKKISLYK